MKAVVCALHARYIHSALAPWYLRAAAETFCRRPAVVEVIEGTVNEPPEAVLDRLLAAQADLIGFSCYIWNIGLVAHLTAQLAQRAPEVSILLGGPEVSFRPEEVFQALPAVHYIQCGEGERPFAQLLDALTDGREPDDVPGLCRRLTDGTWELREPCRTRETPPSPYGEAYFAALKGRIAYLETSRGCPFSCAFCLSGREEGVRWFPLDRAQRELLLLARSGTRTVKLVDRTFNAHPARCHALFAFLIEQAQVGAIPPWICFHFEVAADLFTDETLDLLATAPPGLIQMEAGLQSFHAPTLEAVTRRTDLGRLCGNLRRLLAPQNIHIHIDLIAGLPYEDADTFARSFDQAFALRPHCLQLGFLKLLHGSRLRREADAYGYRYDEKPPYVIREGGWLREADIDRLRGVEGALDRLYNSGRFLRAIDCLLTATGYTPFALFDGFGRYAAAHGGLAGRSLDEVAAWLLIYGAGLPGCDGERLRDAMVCDILSTRRGGRLPACLYRGDPQLKKLKRAAARLSADPTAMRSVARLLAPPDAASIVIAEYGAPPHPVTGAFPLRRAEPSALLRDAFGCADGDPPV